MQGSKLIRGSHWLQRRFHVDVFRTEIVPSVLVLLFGGSGISRDEYERRERSVNPDVEPALAALGPACPVVLFYVTAPYDLPFVEFDERLEESQRWERHVVEELMGLSPELPVYLIGYSGGAALALHGPHRHERCIGVGGLGADGLPESLEEGPAWREPLRLYYNRADAVFEANREAIARFEELGVAHSWRQHPGGHRFGDYVANRSLEGLLRRAAILTSEGTR